MTDEELTYEELATHYDRIYHDKPYAAEASRVVSLLRKEGAREGGALLEVGCGTGNHVQHFQGTFEVTGVDVHEPVLEIARERVPEARFVVGDVTSLNLGRRFDALTCLFGVIGYVETWGNLEAAIARMADHLEPGAPFVIESWLPPEVFDEQEGQPYLRTYRGDEVTLARVAIPHRTEGETAKLQIEWLIARPGEPIQRHQEIQRMGVFDVDRTLEILEECGLEAGYDPEGLTERRGLFVGTKRS